MSEATVKISGWKPQGKPDNEDELSFYRKLVVEAVYGLSFAKKQAFGMDCSVSLEEIFTEVEHKLFYLEMCRALKYAKRGKRYVDRRVNESACAKFYGDGVPKIVAATAGFYVVNTKRLEVLNK